MQMEGQVKFFSQQNTSAVSLEKDIAVISKAFVVKGD